MDLMIPASRDRRMPAASSLGLFDDLLTMPPTVRTHFELGLECLETRASKQHNKPFADLKSKDAKVLVDAQRQKNPAFINVMNGDFEVDEIQFIPQTMAPIAADDVEMFDKFMAMLNDLDDVQNVYHNAEL